LIFRLLDGAKKGRINATDIDIYGVSTDVLIVLQPLLNELEQFNESLDE